MYLDHFGLSEAPFRITPHTDFFFSGANRGATLDALIYAITHDEGIVKVGGEVGSGKTMLCRVLMERLPKHVETIYLANPSLSRDEILNAIADELQLEVGNKRASRLLRELQEHLIKLYAESRRVVVLIDEAHAMPADTLEEIRLLSNLETDRNKLLQIVLFGQPELDEHLNTSEMRQLKDRITHSFRLEPLLRRDVEGYIDFRMRAAGYRGPNVFSREAIRLIASASDGLTRRINILADKALLAAFADNTHAVTVKEVRRAVRDSEFFRPRAKPSRLWLTLGGVAAGLALGIAAYYPFRAAERTREGPVSRIQDGPAAATGKMVEPAAGALPAARGEGADVAAKPASVATAAALAAPTAAASASPRSQGGAQNKASLAARSRAAPERGPIVRERFEAAQSWLEGAPTGHYAIQLMTVSAKELPRLESFLLHAAKLIPKEEIFVYSVRIDGAQHYRAAYGNFTGTGEAVAALKELPPPLRANAPYLRPIERMRSQNRQ